MITCAGSSNLFAMHLCNFFSFFHPAMLRHCMFSGVIFRIPISVISLYYNDAIRTLAAYGGFTMAIEHVFAEWKLGIDNTLPGRQKVEN